MSDSRINLETGDEPGISEIVQELRNVRMAPLDAALALYNTDAEIDSMQGVLLKLASARR